MSDTIKLLVESQTNVLNTCKIAKNPDLYIPLHKEVITNFYSLQVSNINTGNLMKNANITCNSLKNILIF